MVNARNVQIIACIVQAMNNAYYVNQGIIYLNNRHILKISWSQKKFVLQIVQTLIFFQLTLSQIQARIQDVYNV